MGDDLWETLFFLFADPWVILVVVVILILLCAFGVIPWSEWLT